MDYTTDEISKAFLKKNLSEVKAVTAKGTDLVARLPGLTEDASNTLQSVGYEQVKRVETRAASASEKSVIDIMAATEDAVEFLGSTTAEGVMMIQKAEKTAHSKFIDSVDLTIGASIVILRQTASSAFKSVEGAGNEVLSKIEDEEVKFVKVSTLATQKGKLEIDAKTINSIAAIKVEVGKEIEKFKNELEETKLKGILFHEKKAKEHRDALIKVNAALASLREQITEKEAEGKKHAERAAVHEKKLRDLNETPPAVDKKSEIHVVEGGIDLSADLRGEEGGAAM